ncbi:hypothetical protein [Radiobacillus sp. PE A8.2]|uniref:hypothetical protein n=1 Tax=Radiobacillus sp. PE A8.2 TaxID=3380349 RepID=UPI00388D752A
MKKTLMIGYIILIGFTFYPNKYFAETGSNAEGTEFEMEVSPSGILFNIDDMKPGDWAPRTITIQNSGNKDFQYQMTIRNDGTEKLFNELLLEIVDVNGELYNGKISEFVNMPLRTLDKSTNEEIEITIRYPEYLGNDFQGLNSKFSFIFTAEGKGNDKVEVISEGQVGSGNGGSLPDTSSQMFNFLLLGVFFTLTSFMIMHYLKTQFKSEKNEPN